MATLNPETLRDRFALIQSKRNVLNNLLEQPNLGTLRLDINQALEEVNDLIDDLQQTFPELRGQV